ncbi:MAG TPA: DinB family protein [Flavipsychrobacter sp.]|nr:DinB family protein [Flavipsychrobacter sp.]
MHPVLQPTIDRLTYLCNTIPAMLKIISDKDFSHKPAPDKWSKKEILGHLIDSAANNHQRFVRVQFEDTPFIIYNQDNWNSFSHHQDIQSGQVITFWELYNRYLLEIIKRIPPGLLQRKCRTNESSDVTLQWIIEDYVVHMEHHLHEIVNYV